MYNIIIENILDIKHATPLSWTFDLNSLNCYFCDTCSFNLVAVPANHKEGSAPNEVNFNTPDQDIYAYPVTEPGIENWSIQGLTYSRSTWYDYSPPSKQAVYNFVGSQVHLFYYLDHTEQAFKYLMNRIVPSKDWECRYVAPDGDYYGIESKNPVYRPNIIRTLIRPWKQGTYLTAARYCNYTTDVPTKVNTAIEFVNSAFMFDNYYLSTLPYRKIDFSYNCNYIWFVQPLTGIAPTYSWSVYEDTLLPKSFSGLFEFGQCDIAGDNTVTMAHRNLNLNPDSPFTFWGNRFNVYKDMCRVFRPRHTSSINYFDKLQRILKSVTHDYPEIDIQLITGYCEGLLNSMPLTNLIYSLSDYHPDISSDLKHPVYFHIFQRLVEMRSASLFHPMNIPKEYLPIIKQLQDEVYIPAFSYILNRYHFIFNTLLRIAVGDGTIGTRFSNCMIFKYDEDISLEIK